MLAKISLLLFVNILTSHKLIVTATTSKNIRSPVLYTTSTMLV